MIHLQALWAFIASNPVAIILCLAVYMLVGFVWYGNVFKKPWARMTGMDKASDAELKKVMIPATVISLVTAFVQATVLGRGMQILNMGHWSFPLIIATVLWLPFTALIIAQGHAYTRKPFTLTLIDAGYQLVSLWAMSLVLFTMAL